MIENILKEASSWEKLSQTKLPIILYGTGNGADSVLENFKNKGVSISDIMASDGFVRERFFQGFKVKSLSEIENTYAEFVIALSFASSLPDVLEIIKKLSKKHPLVVPVVPVFGDTVMDREYLTSNKEALENSYNLLADKESKRVFENMIRFQFTGELPYLFDIESTREDALKNILKLTEQEDMLDLGAYRGDTVEEIIRLFGGVSSATCFEPDPKTFQKLLEYSKKKENVTPLPFAAWCEEREFNFSGGGGRQSAIYENGKQLVKAVAVDRILKETQRVTYVKMDVEGAEKEALMGMKRLLKSQKPKLSIAAYHRTEDLCTLIPLIKSLNPEYKIHLRHHPYIPCWDTNLYCI